MYIAVSVPFDDVVMLPSGITKTYKVCPVNDEYVLFVTWPETNVK